MRCCSELSRALSTPCGITGDLELGYNEPSFTRIDPRQVQSYKIHANYKPQPRAKLDGGVEIHENRDNVFTVDNLEHDRSYSFSTMFMAKSSPFRGLRLQLLECLHPVADLFRVFDFLHESGTAAD